MNKSKGEKKKKKKKEEVCRDRTLLSLRWGFVWVFHSKWFELIK